MRKTIHFTLAVFIAYFVLSCSPVFAESGVALIKGTEAGSPISGKAVFTDTPQGLKISVEVDQVPPGKHGFHIHQFGDTGDHGKAAGGHFNPGNTPHGDVLKQGYQHVHPGDLGNIEVGADGTGKLEAVIPGVTLSGLPYAVAGRSVILHEKADDFGQPTGNAGGRIAGGVIVING